MSFDIQIWLAQITPKIKETFKNELLFIGLQGSYARGEASCSSDIDMVVILKMLTLEHLKKYRAIVQAMPDSQKACGFISGRAELESWAKPDLFQFFYDTKAIYGNLSTIISPPAHADITAAVKNGAQNIFHFACHSFLYAPDKREALAGIYKMSFFVLQAADFLANGQYTPTKKELLIKLQGADKEILQKTMDKDSIAKASDEELENLYRNIIEWSKQKIAVF